jgi:hypothetical protein
MRRRNSSNTLKRSNRLIDEVYREMYLLESRRPGSEMGLALALLHAWNETASLTQDDEIRVWLRQVCPLCVKMIEDSLQKGCAGWPVIS